MRFIMNLQMQKYPRARNGGDEAGGYVFSI